jgi:hypothetical protein
MKSKTDFLLRLILLIASQFQLLSCVIKSDFLNINITLTKNFAANCPFTGLYIGNRQ